MAVLHLIPVPIVQVDGRFAQEHLNYLGDDVKALCASIKIWCVEELRTARRFLKAVDAQINIDTLKFFVLNEHQQQVDTHLQKLLKSNEQIGLISEAGCPAVADPGSQLVLLAQQYGAEVRPYIGPSSLLLALMGSGLNGNAFTYHGYIPAKQPQRTQALQALAEKAKNTGAAQILIEAPYRNNSLLEDIIKALPQNMLLCIACNLLSSNQLLKTKTLSQWQKSLPDINKQAAVFILGWPN